jgi:DNA-binding LytR/AlgR family response regulator
MEFDELQKIWDTQNNQPLYAINEKALYNRIASKKKQVIHIARFTEWLLIIVNIAAGSFILGLNYIKHGRFFIYFLSAWMFTSALFVLVSRIRRIISQPRFNRSMLGDLQHAIAAASHQVRLSRIMRWNILPIGLLTLLSIWESGKPVWMVLVISLFFILVFYASGWEHNIYKAKKQELEGLQNKLQTLEELS